MRSLQTRLTTGLIVTLAFLTALVVVVGNYSLRHLAEDFVATRLEHDMDALLAALSFDDAGQLWLRQGRLNPVFHQPYSGHYFKLRSDDFELRSRSLWDADLDIPPTTPDAVIRYFFQGPDNQQLLALARTFQVQGRLVELAVTEDFTPLTVGLRQLMIGFLVIALIALALLMWVQRWIVQQELKPLERVRQDILRLARGEIRQLHEQVPREVKPLVQEINRLIEVIGQRLQRSRHALGNLAHALKSPLTVLTQLATHPDVKCQETLGSELECQTRQIQLLMERELKRARIAGAAVPGQRVLLTTEITDLVTTLKKIYRDKPLDIQCQIPSDASFPGDRDDMLELLGNLLDNACKWATNRIEVNAKETENGLRLVVEDDGSGCPSEQLELLTHRGVRVDESRTGHGLGLAIVADILEQYEGQLRLDQSETLGGLRAQVQLPH